VVEINRYYRGENMPFLLYFLFFLTLFNESCVFCFYGLPTWKYTKTINDIRFQATLKEREFELKFILTYWGLIGFDFGFINLSNVFIDRLRVPKYFFIAPIRKPTLPTNYFIEPIFSGC
jgi:hypothetical protein